MTCVSILKRHVIALLYRYELAIVVVATRGGDNRVPRPGPRRHAGDDGDHAGAFKMEIKNARKGYTISHYICM